ncbi:OLC1v1002489C2 [Oldenlandia corymbosa var. corymbosa]|nr:OLC1v1002489C2 [Oldenlandia corymbosa var. corymbosa]
MATTFMVMCLFVLLHYSDVAEAAPKTYYVGGITNGWTFNVQSWSRGKRFAVGDTLVFKYNRSFHNVVAFYGPRNGGNFAKCIAPRGATVRQTGRDLIKLVKGPNYFICSYPGHCQSGMKIAIFV